MNRRFKDMYEKTRPDEKTVRELKNRLASQKPHISYVKYPAAAAAFMLMIFSAMLLEQKSDITADTPVTAVCESTDILSDKAYDNTDTPSETAAFSEEVFESTLPAETNITEAATETQTPMTEAPAVSSYETESTAETEAQFSESEQILSEGTAKEYEYETEPVVTEMTMPSETAEIQTSEHTENFGEALERLGYGGGKAELELRITNSKRLSEKSFLQGIGTGTFCHEIDDRTITDELISSCYELVPTEDFEFYKEASDAEYAQIKYASADGRNVYIIIHPEKGLYIVTSRPHKEVICFGYDSSELFDSFISLMEGLCAHTE